MDSQNVIKGIISGLIATSPMTHFMKNSFKELPSHEKYPLPPREITEVVLAKAGHLDQKLDESTK